MSRFALLVARFASSAWGGAGLFGVFGEAGGWVVFAVVVGGVTLFIFEVTRRATKRHTDAMQTIASNLNLKFDPEGQLVPPQGIRAFFEEALEIRSLLNRNID